MATETLEAVVRLLATEIARAVVAELRAGQNDMIDQSASTLGRRRHIAAVRRRVAAGTPGAAVVGRRYLLAREAVAEELAALAKGTKAPPAKVDDLSDLRARYGLLRRAS